MSKAKFYNREENQHHLITCLAIIKHLRTKHNKHPLREWVVFYDHEDRITSISYEVTREQKERNERYKCPDIIWQDEMGTWVLEVDGVVHWDKSNKTEKRDNFYKSNNVNYIVINIYEFKPTREEAVYRPLESILREVDEKIS